jgi:zinc transport system permease protein
MPIYTYAFFQNALIGSLLASILCALIGTYVVTRRTVIVGGGMAHASLGGVGLGAYCGFSPLAGAAAFALLTGLAIEHLARQRQVREDSAIALLWTFGMSVGILFAFLTPGFMTDLPAYLFGDILSITRADLWGMGVLTVVTAAVFSLFLSSIITVAYDRDFAVSQGLPVKALETVLTVLTALTIVGCLHMVGIVLVVSLLSVPQLTAALFVSTFRGMLLLSALTAYAGCVGGLWLSYVANVPSGAAIILCSIALYAVCRLGVALARRCRH